MYTLAKINRRLAHAVATATLLGAVAAILPASGAAAATTLHDVVLIGNSADGTVTFLDGHTFAPNGTFNVVPDLSTRLAEIYANPVTAIAYLTVRNQEGGDRFADDIYLSPDGTRLYVSRGNLDDAAAFDLTTGAMVWRTTISGFKADHAVLSPDGTRFTVSATTATEVEVLDTSNGHVVTTVPTGTYPHANDYSPDGTVLYNSSIGNVALPKALDALKGAKQVTAIDPVTFQVKRTYHFSEGVRPAVFTPDNTTMYAQLSYLNGFIEYNLGSGATTRTVQMPFSAHGAALSPDSYPNNSAHHGLAASGDQAKLCDVGTIDDYTAIVSRPSLTTDAFVNYPTGSQPYWATTSVDGNSCLVSLSNANQISVVNYATGAETARIPVGNFPQRERLAKAAPAALANLG
jgi:DNA-binding beta-propeller fold protein YncE